MRITDPTAWITDDDWCRFGALDDACRRSGWYRIHYADGSCPVRQIARQIEKIELCAGREGDDVYCVIERGNPDLEAIAATLFAAHLAAMRSM